MEITDRKSRFTGHATRVKGTKDVAAAYKKIELLYPESDHIMVAYLVKTYTGSMTMANMQQVTRY